MQWIQCLKSLRRQPINRSLLNKRKMSGSKCSNWIGLDYTVNHSTDNQLTACLLTTVWIYFLIAPTSAYALVTTDFVSMLTNLSKNMKGVWIMLIALSYLLGLWASMSGIFGFKEYGLRSTFMQPQKGMMKPLFKLMLGSALIYLPTAINVLLGTLWAVDMDSVKSYITGEVSWNDIMKPLIAIVQVVGLAAVIRGLVMLTKLGQQNVQANMVSKAMIHLLGGVACINIIGTIDIVEGTLGFANS